MCHATTQTWQQILKREFQGGGLNHGLRSCDTVCLIQFQCMVYECQNTVRGGVQDGMAEAEGCRWGLGKWAGLNWYFTQLEDQCLCISVSSKALHLTQLKQIKAMQHQHCSWDLSRNTHSMPIYNSFSHPQCWPLRSLWFFSQIKTKSGSQGHDSPLISLD